MSDYVVDVGDNQFRVSSFDNTEDYLVDMNCHICECPIGRDGSVCKHQYMLWSLAIASSTNFIPYLDAAQRQQFARIADGASFPLPMYEGKCNV